MSTIKKAFFYIFELDPNNPWPWRPTQEDLRRYAKQFAVLAVLFAMLYGLMTFVPEGFDWKHFFGKGRYPAFWMPWTKPIVALFDLPAMSAMTLLVLFIRTYRYNRSPLPAILALFSLPTIWVIFYLGNVDGLVLLGLETLPWGAPLVLIKPQIASFALLALPLMWFSRRDEDLMMAAGSLATPHLFPYHFIVLLPALGRMRWPWMLLTWFITWTPLLANWLGPIGWHFGNLMSLAFWFGIYLNKPKGLPTPSPAQTSELNYTGLRKS